MASYVRNLLLSILLATLVAAQVNLGGQTIQRKTPHCAANRSGKVIVHLFSWRWTDIAAECENFLGPKGFCGVQVSPPNEHRIVTTPKRPWWERYQPVSYKLDSASGTRDEFIDMVNKCNDAGVKVYVDAVINYMVAGDAGTGVGTAGSAFDAQMKKYPGVPYGPLDFTHRCKTASGNVEDFKEKDQMRNCDLLGMSDLNTGSDYVRGKLADYLEDMLEIGIDGYQISNAKHIWPADLDTILGMPNNTISSEVPFVYQDVIDFSGQEAIKASDYEKVGRVTEYRFADKLAETFMNNRIALTHLKTFGNSWNFLLSEDAVVFVDSYDKQRGGGNFITFKSPRAYKMAVAFMLSWPYGVPRVMSSYDFTEDWTGPPSNGPGNNGLCENGWICEHRWRQITNMVNWRNAAGDLAVENWWSNGNNQIAYSRGSSAFIAFNKNDGYMNQDLKTGLPIGQYCDVISGDLSNGACTGKTISVSADSTANIQIDGDDEDPIIAIHLGSKLNSSPGLFGPTQSPANQTGFQRTIVFIKKNTKPGDDVFLRGGCGPDCKVPITYHTARVAGGFVAYNDWSQGDTELDWNGAEQGQGQYRGRTAEGSPMVWTDSNPLSPSYDSQNTFGDHYWMWDVMMDCSKTSAGYFELKGYMSGFEHDIRQGKCTGEANNAVTSSQNHIARCGYKNVFKWNDNSCYMVRL